MSSQTVVGNLAVELGMSTEEFQRALAHAQVQAQQAANKIQAKINQAGSSATAGSMKGASQSADGILQLSRAIDDAQYGLRGVINNVEGIARGFGLGTGVAAMATIAAVSIGAIAPLVGKATDEAAKFFDVWKSESETAKDSVAGLMGGGFGGSAMASALRSQAEFLMNRTDSVGGMNIDMISRAFGMGSNDERAIENNMRRAVEAAALMQQSFRAAADASKALAAAQRGASAQYDLTTGQQSAIALNRQVFQAAIDRFGGGDNLRTKLKIESRNAGMINSDSERLYGQFANGEIPATEKVVKLLGLQAEYAKVMAEDTERVTGMTAELAHIEEQRKNTAKETAEFIQQEQRWLENSIRMDEEKEAKRKKNIFERQFGEYASAVNQQGNLLDRRGAMQSAMQAAMNRSEIIGTADVFARNINAGQKSEELKELEKINESIKELGTLTGILN